MMAMLPFALFNYKRVKQIKASQKCGAFLILISKIAGLVESVVVCVCVAKRRCNAHDNTRRFIPCFYAVKLEVSVGAYKCKNCGYEIVPTYKEAMMAMHRGTTRHLMCPKCNKRTWCKKVLKK